MMFMNSAYAQTISTQLSTATSTVTTAITNMGMSAAQNTAAAANPYGLSAIWSQGDWIAKPFAREWTIIYGQPSSA